MMDCADQEAIRILSTAYDMVVNDIVLRHAQWVKALTYLRHAIYHLTRINMPRSPYYQNRGKVARRVPRRPNRFNL